MTRICIKCLQEKSLENFKEYTATNNRCNECIARYKAELYKKNKGLPGAPCSLDDCSKKCKAKGLCSTHYSRLQRYGTTDLMPPLPFPPELATKTCSKCKIEKNTKKDFYKDSRRPGYVLPHCKPCHKGNAIENALKRKYGIDLKEYEKMFKNQNGLCKVCNRPQYPEGDGIIKRFVVDHCHITGKIRGLLHNQCNRFLGMAEENIDILQGAIDYLKANK